MDFIRIIQTYINPSMGGGADRNRSRSVDHHRQVPHPSRALGGARTPGELGHVLVAFLHAAVDPAKL